MSIETLSSEDRGLRGWLRRNPLLALSILVLLTTTPLLSWQTLADTRRIAVPIPFPLVLLTGWLPGIAAMILAGGIDGRAGVRQLLGRFLIARLHPGWYLLALFAPLAYLWAGVGLYSAFGGRVTDMPFYHLAPGRWLPSVLLILVVGFIFNQEEIAWRAFALPRLQPRYGALDCTVLISIPEFFIHFPYFFNPTTTQAKVGPGWFYIVTLAEAILFAAIFNNTRGSLLIVSLIHAAQNAWEPLFENPAPWPFVIMTVLIAITALLVVKALGPARLARRSEPATVVTGPAQPG